jgi:hypothetical protein
MMSSYSRVPTESTIDLSVASFSGVGGGGGGGSQQLVQSFPLIAQLACASERQLGFAPLVRQ